MKTPTFWYDTDKTPPLWARGLSVVYGMARQIHCALTTPVLSPLPTLCIGNVTAGGGGKTPTLQALYALLNLPDSFVLTRGYGGQMEGPVRVNPAHHTADDVGDESLLHARHAPVMVAQDRMAGARAIAAQGGKIILMDDGLQSRTLRAQGNILVVDGALGFGNGNLLPAGPLREPLEKALARADAIILISRDRTGTAQKIPPHLPVFMATAQTDISSLQPNTPYIAFAGIAWPPKFYDSLRSQGVTLINTKDFPDHHVFTARQAQDLVNCAAKMGARLVTTEKDFVRWPREVSTDLLDIAPLTLTFQDPVAIKDFILRLLSS